MDAYPDLERIDEKLLRNVIEDAVDWAHGAGMVMRTPERKDCSDICQTAPFALFPSPFPRFLFEQAMDVQEAMSLLYFRISWDFDFLMKAHCDVVKTDDFTRRMADMLKTIHSEGIKQTKTLIIQRSDYMCHCEGGDLALRQIEVNNIASSMGGLSERVTALHKRLLQDLNVPNEIVTSALPVNKPVDTVARGIFEAWSDFNDERCLVLFVVEETNQNQLDQRHVEYRLDKLSERRAKCIRMTLTECGKRLSLGGKDGYSLMLDNGRRIAVVYFRAGYVPEHYLSDFEWDARLLLERSNAVKCPWIGLQLANTKKVQQILTCKGEVERFLPSDPVTCSKIRSTFAKIWGLEKTDDVTKKIIEEAIANPNSYVLKPQLEGGGGNYYGSEVAEMLQRLDGDEKAAHILMERIFPKAVKNFLIRPLQETKLINTIGELGIFGYLYGNGSFAHDAEKIVFTNHTHGHIIRSKAETENRGGIAVGAAVVDSPYLF